MFSAALEGRKVSSLKRRVRSHLWRWEMKSCTPLWREGHVEVKMSKKDHMFGALLEVAMFKSARPCGTKRVSKLKWQKHHVRSTFGSWDVGKVHSVVARSTCRSMSKSKCRRHTILGPILAVEMSKKCTLLWREAHVEAKMQKDTPFSHHFWKLRCRTSARRCGAKHIPKSKL